ncbi:MAG: AAA family ATPase [Lachnospiraceae bacterium]|nr:AAA family ATPase [Lachnospiraceae bacterium]
MGRYRPLPIGIDDFQEMIEKGYYYVDKTLFIQELLDRKGSVNLFMRPRRFGKTLTLSMVKYYFEQAYDFKGNRIDHSGLFAGLNIMKVSESYHGMMGQFPVIFLTLKAAKQENFSLAYAMIVREIADEFRRHSHIAGSSNLSEEEKERYRCICREQDDPVLIYDSLKFLSQCLYKVYGKKAIILIDEYDVPLEAAYFAQFYDKMIGFIRSLFESGLKSNPYLEFSVITGCLRISKESAFTGLNNLNMMSVLDELYAEYFGFTQSEVDKALIFYGRENLWNFLFFTGYLKKMSDTMEGRNIKIKLAIPNEEIKYIYENIIIDWFQERIKKENMNELYQPLEKGNCKLAGELISTQLSQTISFYDYAENFYHGFMLGLLSQAQSYVVKSNRETGNGRADIVMYTPSRRGMAIILELKLADTIDKLQETCEKGLQQIADKGYDRELIEDGYKNIQKYAVAFYKKDCEVMCRKSL